MSKSESTETEEARRHYLPDSDRLVAIQKECARIKDPVSKFPVDNVILDGYDFNFLIARSEEAIIARGNSKEPEEWKTIMGEFLHVFKNISFAWNGQGSMDKAIGQMTELLNKYKYKEKVL